MSRKKNYPRSEDQCTRCKAHAMQDTTLMVDGGKSKARYCRRCKLIASEKVIPVGRS